MRQGFIFPVFRGDLFHGSQGAGIILFIFQTDCFVEPQVPEGLADLRRRFFRKPFRQELLIRKSLPLPEYFLRPGTLISA